MDGSNNGLSILHAAHNRFNSMIDLLEFVGKR